MPHVPSKNLELQESSISTKRTENKTKKKKKRLQPLIDLIRLDVTDVFDRLARIFLAEYESKTIISTQIFVSSGLPEKTKVI